MGVLIRKGNPQKEYKNNQASDQIQYNSYYYKNSTALDNVLHYITRTRNNESRANELLFWGSFGASNTDVDLMIKQFKYVQALMRYKTERKLYHLSYNFDDIEMKHLAQDIDLLNQIAVNQSLIYYRWGHQVAYAAHYENNRIHIHFVINSVNFCTGLMLRYSPAWDREIQVEMDAISHALITQKHGGIFPFSLQYNQTPAWMKPDSSPIAERKKSDLLASRPDPFYEFADLPAGTVIFQSSQQ